MGLRESRLSELVKEKNGKMLHLVEDSLHTELEKYSWSRFYGPLVYAAEGGKRIRPLILLLSGEAVTNKGADLLPAAVAVELLHTESIIHDDVIDQEGIRRDRMAFHVKYGYGASMLSADFVFGMILEIASRYENPRVAQELSTAALRMCEGEFAELKIDPKICRITREEYIEILSLKTASLFQTAAKLGAIIGGGRKEEVSALSSYGLQLGIAYQIQDDILDWGQKGKITSCLTINSKKGDEILLQLNKMARIYAAKAKNDLKVLSISESRSRLEMLADFSAERLE